MSDSPLRALIDRDLAIGVGGRLDAGGVDCYRLAQVGDVFTQSVGEAVQTVGHQCLVSLKATEEPAEGALAENIVSETTDLAELLAAVQALYQFHGVGDIQGVS